MAFGGIYDQIGGGFARYSVDGKWHVPHFEKMLYDNAQLVSLYSEAYQYTPDPIYKNIVYQSLDFVERELTSVENGFYSALDADSEGVEGKFYTFTKDEIKAILKEDEDLFCIYYQITDLGNWEEENTNILMRGMEDSELATQLGLSLDELSDKISKANKKLLAARSERIRPGLDNKILASWNGMMLKAYTDAYRVFGQPEFLAKAKRSADFIQSKLIDGNEIRRVYSSTNSSDEWAGAFLDDYAFVIDGLIGLYEVSFDESILFKAKLLTDYSISEFYDTKSGMFFYTPNSAEQLIARKQEIMDNVIPSSNSVMANNLYKLGHFFEEQNYLDISLSMLRNVHPHIKSYGSAYSNWAILLLNNVFGLYEIAITGINSEEKRMEMEKYYIPNKILLGGTSGTLPLLKHKFDAETKIYVCRNKTCLIPVKEALDAFKQIDNPNTMPGGQD
jgi:uncharacterized protein YyaL (SSP411 family)